MNTYSNLSLNKNVSLFPASVHLEGLTNINEVLQESKNISDNINVYKTTNQRYDTGIYKNDVVDKQGNLIPQNDIREARKKDLQTIIIQENTLFMVGVITTATLIIAAILISK